MTIPNATEFELHRWFEGRSPKPVFQVIWTNSWSIQDDDGGYDDDEQQENFDTLDEALAFARVLMTSKVCQGCGAEAVTTVGMDDLCAACAADEEPS